MDSLAWLRYAQSALFSPLRGKMLTHFILPESLGFSERTPEVCTNLSYRGFVLCWERITVDFRVRQYASTLYFACAPFLAPKALRRIGNSWLFGTNSGSANEPLLWEVRFVLGTDNG